MKNLLFAAVAALAVASAGGASAQPSPVSPRDTVRSSSAASLNALSAEWDRIGFIAPSKPAQHRVYGRDGHVTDGPGYNVMVSLIRSATIDSRAGRDAEALAKIGRVKRLLAS